MARVIATAILLALVGIGPAIAQETCASRAMDKNGKPLSGASLTSFMNKCKRESCETKAIGKDNRPLSGAAKTSFMKKCEAETS
jgi:hypothetical protein